MRDPVPLDTIAFALRESRSISRDTGHRATVIALAAVTIAFPGASRREISDRLGLNPGGAATTLQKARASRDWNEVHVDHVVGALVAPQYGARAA